MNKKDNSHVRSPSPHSIAAQHVRGLVKMLEHAEDQVEVLQDKLRGYKEESELTHVKHKEELERYHDHINSLEEQMTYQKGS